jgi:hypothetical protein
MGKGKIEFYDLSDKATKTLKDFETNTFVLSASSALSSGVFQARNRCHSSDS